MSHIFFTPIPVSASWLVKFTTWSLALVRLTLMLMLVLRICSTKHWSWHPFPDSIVSQWKQLCLALPRCHEIAQALAWNTSQPLNLIVEFQSNLSASIFYSCQGKESARRLLHWLNERAGTVGVQNRTEKILWIHTCHWHQSLKSTSHKHVIDIKLGHFSHPWNSESAPMKLWICTDTGIFSKHN